MFWCRNIFFILSLLAGASTLFADDVWMENGSVLRGRVLSINGDFVVLETNITNNKELRIKQSEVATIVIEHSCEVVLKNGERLVGPLDASTTDGFLIVGGKEIFVEDIREVFTKDAQQLLIEAAERQRFKTEIELGLRLNAQQGNTESLNGGLHFDLVTKNDKKQLKIYSKYLYGKVRSYNDRWTKSNDKFLAGIEWRDDFYDPVLWYILTENGYDHTLNQRFSDYSALGLGVNIIKEDKHSLIFRMGLSYRYDDLHDYMNTWEVGKKYDNTSVAGLDVAVSHEYKWSQSKVVTELKYSPSFDSYRDHYVATCESYYQAELPSFQNMYIRLGMRHDYDSTREYPKKLDSYYYTSLVFKWK
ncbi:MAG: DUF481 domain-containing protein [Opitutales bacterium]|nr:DUF481 domain-containing protein [Opitutales bacterium]